MSLFYVGHGTAAGGDIGKEVAHVSADCRSHVTFQIFFGFILRILLVFINNFTVQRLAFAMRLKVVFVNAGFQRSFVAIECRTPRVLFIRCIAIRAVLPNDAQIIKVKCGGLRVGRVGFAIGFSRRLGSPLNRDQGSGTGDQ